MAQNVQDTESYCSVLSTVPSYENVHRVQAAPWSYPEDLVSEMVGSADNGVSDNQRLVDLAQEPPEYEENEEYLARVKQDLGIEVSQDQGILLLFGVGRARGERGISWAGSNRTWGIEVSWDQGILLLF